VNTELRERGFSEEAVQALQPLLSLQGSNEEQLQQLRNLLASSDIGQKGIGEMEEIFAVAEKMGLSLQNVGLDTTLARGLSYYTGAIFEVKALGVF